MAWTDQLQQASFRGVPFGVLGADSAFGRRHAVHEYPYRDKPWIEDLGRATRRISFRAFLVSDSRIYGGGDVIAQRDRVVGAAEQNGVGTLIHPTLGRLQVSCVSIAVSEQMDAGRYFELSLQFIEVGERIFPSTGASLGDITNLAAVDLDNAAAGDFLSRAVADLKLGAAVVNQVVSTATKWATPALNLVRDATNLSNLASNLPGAFGRYFGGANVGGFGLLGDTGNLLVEGSSSVSSLITAGTQARALVDKAVDTFLSLAGSNSPKEFAASAQSVAAAVLQACADPADGVRLLSQLAAPLANDPVIGTPPIGAAMADIQIGCADLFRRAAAAAVARASAKYQPSSYDDAIAVRGRVVDLLDRELTIAGDQGEDDTYQALRELRLAVVKDLTDRGANLAAIATFEMPSSMPSLALAQRLYRDPKREEQLVKHTQPIHPLFMPTRFKALSK